MGPLPHEKEIEETEKTIEHLKKQNLKNPLFTKEIKKLEEKLGVLKTQVYKNLTPWERIQISRHPLRPHSIDYIENLTDDFHELSGDRLYGDDHALIGGIGEIQGIKCVLIGQEKGNDTESRIYRNFGMMNPEGFRKALRLMKLAEKFKLPVVSFLDTPGANPVLEAEERGQGGAIAMNLREMAALKVPILVIVIGEGCSGGALGIGVGDRVGMLEHSYYSVISPEGCASILYKDSSKKESSAEALKLTSEELLSRGVIDKVIKEPLGGAHQDKALMIDNVKAFITEEILPLQKLSVDELLERRYQKFRKIGEVFG
ncbi:MAG: acetyl-CoA carboxylase carboxyltransferase subunit alpha [Chlamydiia bacterium]|nr:acetyl-CoA carboxylase carboxyltransferase subunit alpha [Chlamydiia bacterium]